jgi:hypothetical protein
VPIGAASTEAPIWRNENLDRRDCETGRQQPKVDASGSVAGDESGKVFDLRAVCTENDIQSD